MQMSFTGKVIILGDNIDTDQIYPGNLLAITNPREIGGHCLSGLDPAIAGGFEKGGIVVAGSNFGCGSSREHAVIALINMGASAVLADSFARIFFRNAINLGLPVLVCKGLNSKLADKQEIMVNIEDGAITVIKTGEIIYAEKIGGHAMEILNAGGIKAIFRDRNQRLDQSET